MGCDCQICIDMDESMYDEDDSEVDGQDAFEDWLERTNMFDQKTPFVIYHDVMQPRTCAQKRAYVLR